LGVAQIPLAGQAQLIQSGLGSPQVLLPLPHQQRFLV
jgi:hypothetical protein